MIINFAEMLTKRETGPAWGETRPSTAYCSSVRPRWSSTTLPADGIRFTLTAHGRHLV